MVLNDQAGLHLGAGALLLVYTKAGSMDASHALSWSPDFVVRTLFDSLKRILAVDEYLVIGIDF